MKTCAHCGVTKPLNDFYAHAHSAQGRVKRCKQCMVIISRLKRPPRLRPTSIERFLKKFVVTPGCWLWTGPKDGKGYGMFRAGEKTRRAHRFSYALYVGVIPENMLVCHRCDTPACVNPAHLFIGTSRDNAEDREQKGRGVRPSGEAHHNAKLTMEQAKAIRADNRKQREIAADYGISQHAVWAVKQNKVWRTK